MTLGNVALQVPLGLFSDRVDRRRLLLVSAVAGLIGAAALPLVARDLVPTSILLFVWGGFTGGLYTVGLAHLAQRFTGADLAASNSAFVFAYAAGALVGPAILGLGMEALRPARLRDRARGGVPRLYRRSACRICTADPDGTGLRP